MRQTDGQTDGHWHRIL